MIKKKTDGQTERKTERKERQQPNGNKVKRKSRRGKFVGHIWALPFEMVVIVRNFLLQKLLQHSWNTSDPHWFWPSGTRPSAFRHPFLPCVTLSFGAKNLKKQKNLRGRRFFFLARSRDGISGSRWKRPG